MKNNTIGNYITKITGVSEDSLILEFIAGNIKINARRFDIYPTSTPSEIFAITLEAKQNSELISDIFVKNSVTKKIIAIIKPVLESKLLYINDTLIYSNYGGEDRDIAIDRLIIK